MKKDREEVEIIPLACDAYALGVSLFKMVFLESPKEDQDVSSFYISLAEELNKTSPEMKEILELIKGLLSINSE